MAEQDQVIDAAQDARLNPTGLVSRQTALIVVDMQCYFTQPSFPFMTLYETHSPGYGTGYLTRVREQVIPNIKRLLACFRELGFPIIYTALGSETGDGTDLPYWLRSADELGLKILGTRVIPTEGDISWRIDQQVEPMARETVLCKQSAGTFATTDLERWLRKAGIENVVIAGLVTEVCVSTTAREAADRNFKVVTVSDACTTIKEELHQPNLDALYVFGRVLTTDEVISEMRASFG